MMGLVPLLLPFVWILELDSCGHPVPRETEITGTMVVGKFELEGWLVVIPVLLAVILTPYFAVKIPKPEWRVVVHIAGFAAALLAGWGAFFAMFFTIFAERMARGVGWVVIAALAGSIIDALLRVVWSIQEWLAARTASRSAPG